nr:MAG TPA: hypothetical protein [Microviridae sp.]
MYMENEVISFVFFIYNLIVLLWQVIFRLYL